MARRRHNPRLLTFGDVLPTVMLLAVGYWLWVKFKATPAEVARGAREAWNLLTIAPVSNVNSVRMPTGEVVTVNAIVSAGGIDRDGNFSWQGAPYQISGTDAQSGLYVAKRIVT